MSLSPHKWADLQTAAPRKLQALLHALASFANASGLAYPSQETIARRLGWSKGTIKKWSDIGRALGLFSTRKRFNPSKGHVDVMAYTLHLDRVAAAEEVATQIANLRFPRPKANRKNRDFPPPEANRKNEGGKSQLAANNSKNSKELTKEAIDEQPSDGSPNRSRSPSRAALAPVESRPARDWLLVTGPKGEQLRHVDHHRGIAGDPDLDTEVTS